MSQSRLERFSIRDALGLSTVLHALIAPLFVVSSVALVGAGQSAEPLGFRGGELAAITTLTIEHRQRQRATPLQVEARPLAPKKAEPKRARPVARHSSAVDTPAQGSSRATARRGRVAAAEGSAIMSVMRNAIVTQPVAAATLAPKAEASAASAPTSAPGSQASAPTVVLAASVQSASGHGYDSPNGGWGQNFERPLLADEGSLSDLRSRYHFAATITVNVDENGRATKITFPNAVPADARPEIEKRLTSLRYVPAECNGLRCPASLSIVL